MSKYQDFCVFSDTCTHCIHFSESGFCGLSKKWIRDRLLHEKHPRDLY